MATSFIGDTGTEIIVEFQAPDCSGKIATYDISGSSEVRICLKRPDGTTVDRVAAFTGAPCGLGTGTDGKASIFSLVTDFDQDGTYKVSGKVTFASGDVFRSSESTFKVTTPLCP